MLTPRIFKIRSSLLGGSKPLTIDNLFIETIDYLQEPVRFEIEDIDAVRMGGEGHNLSFFTLSRTWALDIRGSDGTLIQIRYYSFFGIGAKRKRASFDEILRVLNETFFNQLCLHYFRLLQNQLAFDLGGALLSTDGIKLTKKSGIVPWNRIGMKQYGGHFILYDIRVDQVYQSFDFFHTWNALILFYVVSNLLPEKKMPGNAYSK